MNIINSNQTISKIRSNLWQVADGAVIGYGAILAPGGLYYCFTCSADDCPHVGTVDEAWVAGEDSAEIPFDGMVDEPLDYDNEELVFVSGAGLFAEYDYGLSEPWL